MKAWVDAMMDEKGNILHRGKCHLDDIQPGNLIFPNQMWLDGLYMGGPFICKYAKLSGHPEYYDIPIEQALLMEKKTLDADTGLWYHAYDETRTADGIRW